MYKGDTLFTREQLIFVCEAALTAAFDRIESALPPTIPLDEVTEHENGIKSWIMAAKETAGMTLAILFAQLEDEGMGAGDVLHVCGMEEAVKNFVEQRCDPKFCAADISGKAAFPDCRPMAERYVAVVFADYLKDDESYDSPITLSDNGYIVPPDRDGAIRRYDCHGNCEEVRHMDDDDWNEWREMFPDDALYFQPENAGDAGTTAKNIKSYNVYRDFDNAKRAHPDCEIEGFVWDDVQLPKFLDVAGPNLGCPANREPEFRNLH